MPAQVRQDSNGQVWARVSKDCMWGKAKLIDASDGSIVVQTQEEYETMLDKQLRAFEASQMPDETGYNGWSNYETWAVNLHLTNSQWLCDYAYSLNDADSLKAWLIDNVSDILARLQDTMPEIRLMYQDLLTSSLQSVNWYEIYDGLHEEDDDE